MLTIAPPSVIRMAIVTGVTLLLILIFYKELLVTSFDYGLSSSLGINSTVMHYALMGMLSVIIVSAFEAVGAILVIAMLILPGATASLLVHRLPPMFVLTLVHALLSAVGGVHLATWLDCAPRRGDGRGWVDSFSSCMGVQPKPRAAPTMVCHKLEGLDQAEGNCLSKG